MNERARAHILSPAPVQAERLPVRGGLRSQRCGAARAEREQAEGRVPHALQPAERRARVLPGHGRRRIPRRRSPHTDYDLTSWVKKARQAMLAALLCYSSTIVYQLNRNQCIHYLL